MRAPLSRIRIRPTRSISESVLGLLPEFLYAGLFWVSFALTRPPLFTPDSGGYIRRGETIVLPDSPEGQPTFGDLSLMGDGLRAWPTVLFYTLVPAGDAPLGHSGRILLQSLLVMLVTIWLARQLARYLLPSFGWVLRSFVYLFALTPTALVYAFVVGAEGPTYIFAFAAIALALELPRQITPEASWPRVAIYAGGAFALGIAALLSRPSSLPVFLAVSALAGVLVTSRRFAPTLRARWVPALASIAIVVLSLGYSGLLQANQSEAWGEVNERAYRIFFALDNGTNPDFADEVAEGLPGDAPSCFQEYPDQPLDYFTMADYGLANCGDDGLEWAQENYFSVMAGYYVEDPENTVNYFISTGADGSRVSAQASEVETASPPVIDQLVFSNPDVDFRNLPAFYLMLTIAAGIVLGLGVARAPTRGVGVASSKIQLIALLGFALAVWAAFYLSFFDHPSAADRKQWPFYMLGTIFAVAVLGTAGTWYRSRLRRKWYEPPGGTLEGVEPEAAAVDSGVRGTAKWE